ncbi:MAG: GNAT family N-acetyltransferase [Thermoleophilia bacterium]|nr:GNAT family N-acetyltransferase [Thermoleophilia bacterium]
MTGATIERVVDPDPSVLAELGRYDAEAFGQTGLRSFDLGVVAHVGAIYLLRVDGVAAGSCQLLRMFDEPGMFWVFGFYVRPAWQGRGFGRRLLSYVAEQVRQAGGAGLRMSVSPANRAAIGLYEGFGFETLRLAADFYGPGEDRYLMEWRTSSAGRHSAGAAAGLTGPEAPGDRRAGRD